MDLMKRIWGVISATVAKYIPWMGPVSWSGLGTFALGFLLGSEGDLYGTAFMIVFWLVGAFIMDGYLKMNNRNDETEGN